MKTSEALVFDIERFAIHDGQGIRTTVFFKGCPLRCGWCHNPEGLSPTRRPIFMASRCIHCRRCEQAAQENQMTYRNDRPYFNLDYAGDFDNLIRACPSGAIRYDSEKYSLDALLEKIKEDKVFFRDDGGVTFSGGEPLLQGGFLLEILKKCKSEGIHTAIETTLYGSLDLIRSILPYLDLIYVDLKFFDENDHEKFTGVSSRMIKEHIRFVLESEHRAKVVIRTPLIPTMTATDENIRAIASFLAGIDQEVRYELLNYNPLAGSKYELVDREYGMEQHKMLSKEQMRHFYDIASQAGLKNLIEE